MGQCYSVEASLIYITYDTYPDYFLDGDMEIENTNYDNELKLFTVPFKWVTDWISKECGISIEEFNKTYNWDDTLAMYEAAYADNVIISESISDR